MIIQGKEVKEKLLQGINLVADTVKPTLGPQAKTVILQGNPPVVINDGVTITKYVSHDDPYVQMGVQLVQNLASKAQEGSGDGTTTACILAQAFCNELFNSEDNMTAHDFNLLMENLRQQTIDFLDNISMTVEDSDILNVATIAANNDASLGHLIQEAFNTVGRDGVITVEESNNYTTKLVLREGMEVPEGYISHLMCNTESGKVEFENPLIFLSNIPFRSFKDLLPMLEYSSQNGRPLLILCKGMESSALNNLLMNLINKTVDCAAILAPNFGDAQIDELADIQAIVGGKVFNHESKDNPQQFVVSDFGTCEKVIISKENTTFVGGEGNADERIATLKETLSEMKGYDAARIKSRITRLKGGVATIKVGASSSIEMREKKERLDDALNATKAALEEGIVVGGGVPFIRLAHAIDAPDWFRKSVVKPYRVLLDNANYTEQTRVVGFEIEKTIDGTNPNWGFNAVSCQHEDLFKAGVFDPVKVSKNSFLAALSIAQLFYSTDVAVLVEE